MGIDSFNRNKRFIVTSILMTALFLLLQACAEGSRGPGGGGKAVFSQAKLDALTPEDILLGGRLYDNWWDAKNQPSEPPTEEQPLWAEREDLTVQQVNSSSWRCKSCHGWDYKGAEGAYSQIRAPDKYTGFPGLLQLQKDIEGNPVEAKVVFNKIANGVTSEEYNKAPHKFSQYLNNDELHALTAFVIQFGWIDIGSALSGSATAGEAIFKSADRGCTDAGCHDNPDKQLKIRTVAQTNPEEFLHKVKFGQPNTPMPGGLNSVDSKDVLAFLRSGKTGGEVGNFSQIKYAAASLSKGGLIYDKWWEVTNGSPP
ncbi:MAG: hypothetical protein OEX19_16585, partial [Gammaproteobacteria bacterium]|nr:hypothetical protein [Gammaproteobacteria bacterium]